MNETFMCSKFVCKGSEHQFTALLYGSSVVSEDSFSILKSICIFWASITLKV